MSGGYFNYKDDDLSHEVFSYGTTILYGIGEEKQVAEAKRARRMNPLEDKVISEIVYDVLCLLHSFDYYKECDIQEDVYLADVKAFKKKWLKSIPKQHVTDIVCEECDNLKQELLKALVVEDN